MLAPEVPVGGRANTRNTPSKPSLPRCFIGYDAQHSEALGICVVSACAALSGDVTLFWKVDRWVPYAVPMPVASADIAWRSTICHLTAAAELRLRGAQVVGDTIARDHFVEFAGERWRLWPLTGDQRAMLDRGSVPQTMPSNERFARAVGVNPEIVRNSLTDGNGLCS